MAVDYTRLPVNSIGGINSELTKIQSALQDAVSRTNTQTNFMDTDLDMNNQRVLNLPKPVSETEPARVKDVKDLSAVSQGSDVVVQDIPDLAGVVGLREGLNAYVRSTGQTFIYVIDPGETTGQWTEKDQLGDDVDVTAASHLTLAQAQASDLKEGQYVRLTDHSNGLYQAVVNTDTGGYYKTGLQNDLKLKLVPTNGELRLSWIGLLSGDATTELQTFASISNDLDVVFDYKLTCTLSDEVNFTGAKSVDFGDTEINFDRTQVTIPLSIGTHSITKLHTLTSGLPIRSATVSFANTLSQGDILCLYNPVDGSFNAHRASYRSGEYIGAAFSNGTTVTFDAVTRDTYPAGSGVYLLDLSKTRVTGKLKMVNTGTAGVCYGLQIRSNFGADYSGLEVYLYGGTHALTTNRNINCYGKGMVVWQSILTGEGLDYGLVQAGNQNCDFEGWFHAERHGHTSGTDGSEAIAVCRDLRVGGRITTTGLGGVPAMDYHGDAENCKCWGYIQGTSLGGHKTVVEEGSTVVSHANNAFALSYAELLSTDHIARGINIIGRGTPTGGRGVIDVGGNSNVLTIATTRGGNFDFSNTSVESNTTGPVAAIRNQGATVDFGVMFDGMVNDCPSASTLLAGTAVSGNSPTFVSFTNDAWGAGLSLDSATEIKGAVLKGVLNIAYNTTQNLFTQGVTFSPSFPSGRNPHVTISDNTGAVGTTSVVSDVINPTNTDFFARILTVDEANFQSSGTCVTRWRAEIS